MQQKPFAPALQNSNGQFSQIVVSLGFNDLLILTGHIAVLNFKIKVPICPKELKVCIAEEMCKCGNVKIFTNSGPQTVFFGHVYFGRASFISLLTTLLILINYVFFLYCSTNIVIISLVKSFIPIIIRATTVQHDQTEALNVISSYWAEIAFAISISKNYFEL